MYARAGLPASCVVTELVVPVDRSLPATHGGAADRSLGVAHAEHAAAFQTSKRYKNGRALEENRLPAQAVNRDSAEAAANGADSIMTPAQANRRLARLITAAWLRRFGLSYQLHPMAKGLALAQAWSTLNTSDEIAASGVWYLTNVCLQQCAPAV